MSDIRVIIESGFKLGEGPVWDVADQRFWFVDSISGTLHRCTAAGTERRRWDMGEEIGSFALYGTREALVALASGLHVFDLETGERRLIAHPEAGKPGVRLNDGRVDARGRFVVGSLDMNCFGLDNRPDQSGGTLYRLDPDFTLHVLQTGVTISNGIGWSPDNSVLYFADSMIDTIYAYDWDDAAGTVSNRRAFANLSAGTIPDGATVDTEGGYWFAANGALDGMGGVRRYLADGTLDRVIDLPVHNLTSVTFGGPELDILFVTTMDMPTDWPRHPLDGSVFAIHGTGQRGIAAPRFGQS